MAPDGLHAHAHTGGVQMGFEGHDLGVLLQHHIVVQFLVGLVGQYIQVDAITGARAPVGVFRQVAFGEKGNAKFQVPGGLPAIGMQMGGAQVQGGIGMQQAASRIRKHIGVAAHFVDRPAHRAIGLDITAIGTEHPALVSHVVKDVTATHCIGALVYGDVVDFPHLDGLHITVFGQPGGHQAEIAPPVRTHCRAGHVRAAQYQIRLAQGPFIAFGKYQRFRLVIGITPGGAIAGPGLDHGQLFVRQGIVALKAIGNANVLFHKPGRHGPDAIADGGAVHDHRRPGPHFVIAHERHRTSATGAVTLLAALLQDRGNMFSVVNLAGLHAKILDVVVVQLMVGDTGIVGLSTEG